jgi:cytochrome c6
LKKLLSIVLLGVALLTFGLQRPALAGDPAHGAQVFTANCNACHLGGKNVVIPTKTLQSDALSQYLEGYNGDPVGAIINQVTKGKGAMPAFGGRLKGQEIEDVAAYVAQQAKSGW